MPADDRRHFVAWSDLTKENFSDDYWRGLYGWFASGGCEIVAGYLADLDMSGFDPKAPPPKTNAFWEIVDASRVPEDAELADALDKLERPDATTLSAIALEAESGFAEWLRDRKNARKIPHRLEDCGYVLVRNPSAKDGLWKINGRRQAIYGRRDLTVPKRMTAASRLARW